MKYFDNLRRKRLEREAERIYLDECEMQANILLIAQFDKSEPFQVKNDRMEHIAYLRTLERTGITNWEPKLSSKFRSTPRPQVSPSPAQQNQNSKRDVSMNRGS